MKKNYKFFLTFFLIFFTSEVKVKLLNYGSNHLKIMLLKMVFQKKLLMKQCRKLSSILKLLNMTDFNLNFMKIQKPILIKEHQIRKLKMLSDKNI